MLTFRGTSASFLTISQNPGRFALHRKIPMFLLDQIIEIKFFRMNFSALPNYFENAMTS
jgi:hypothetical protein